MLPHLEFAFFDPNANALSLGLAHLHQDLPKRRSQIRIAVILERTRTCLHYRVTRQKRLCGLSLRGLDVMVARRPTVKATVLLADEFAEGRAEKAVEYLNPAWS